MDKSFLKGCAMYDRIFISSISGLFSIMLVGFSSKYDNQVSPDIVKCPLGVKLSTVEKHFLRGIWAKRYKDDKLDIGEVIKHNSLRSLDFRASVLILMGKIANFSKPISSSINGNEFY